MEIIGPHHPLRQAAESLVRTIYAKQYGAIPREFPEMLVALLNKQDQPVCVAGVRFGEDGYFSETYLDGPLEAALSAAAGKLVSRQTILEVTNLACIRIGSSFMLVHEIVAHCRGQGMRWGVFTATRRLRRVIGASCLPLLKLVPARRRRVANPLDWGTYYETDPWVCAMPDSIVKPLAFFDRGLGHSQAVGKEAVEIVHG
ncbi:MAG: thermostable hemolysin [Rhodospirillales bacterium]|jgi:hypothetical protein|nr:thermostable hemolysin [Rhodospirillales bacterium]MDP7215101.1 thermostable hemolysin [Rhodospirillales bacterium]HIJ44247.1 hypothetical protein [Rhodospirillaceae bacterium]